MSVVVGREGGEDKKTRRGAKNGRVLWSLRRSCDLGFGRCNSVRVLGTERKKSMGGREDIGMLLCDVRALLYVMRRVVVCNVVGRWVDGFFR